MPSHSVSSWQNFLYGYKDELELLREQAVAEKRQADEIQADEAKVEDDIAPLNGQSIEPSSANNAGMEDQATVDVDANTGSAPIRDSTSVAAGEATAMDVQVDLDTIVKFFVDERDSRKSGYDDAQLWAKLENKV